MHRNTYKWERVVRKFQEKQLKGFLDNCLLYWNRVAA